MDARSSHADAPPFAASDYRLFEPLLALLRLQGFPIGVDDYLRLQVLLERVSPELLLGDTPLETGIQDEQDETRQARAEILKRRYADLLRPLFASTPSQQHDFDAIFSDAWPGDSFPSAPILTSQEPRDEPAARQALAENQTPETRPDTRGDGAQEQDTGGGKAAPAAHRERLAQLKQRRAEERRRAQEQDEAQAEGHAAQIAEAKERAAQSARTRRVRLGMVILGAAAVAIVGIFVLIRRFASAVDKPAEYVWDMPPTWKSLGGAVLFAAQTEKGGAFPPQAVTLTLRRKDNARFTLNGAKGAQLTLDSGVTSPFQLDTGAGIGEQPSAAHTITLRFAPSKAGSFLTHLIVHAPRRQDRVPAAVNIHGNAESYRPPPKEIYDFAAGGSPLTDGLAFPLIGVGDSRKATIELTERHGHRFAVGGGLSILGVDRDLFEVSTVNTRALAARHPFTVVFHPRRAYTASLIDAQLTYRSGRTDAQDPSDIPVRISTSPMAPDIAEAALDITASPSAMLPTRLKWWIAMAGALAAGVAGLLFVALARALKARSAARDLEYPDASVAGASPMGAPFEAALRSGTDLRPFYGPRFAEAAALLSPSVRLDDCVELFDAAATVRATANRAGYPAPVFQPRRAHPPEYLILIHRQTSRDIRADYFTAFARALIRQGVGLKIFYYAGSPDLCFDPTGTFSYALDRLHALYPRRRVLVFGDISPLVDLSSGTITHAARTLARWPVHALFTLDDLTLAGLRLQALYRDESLLPFPVLPATQAGHRRFTEAFPVNPSSRRQGADARDRADLDTDRPLPVLPDPVSSTVSEYVSALRMALLPDPRLFTWLCACALYPRLFYDLTILIGTHIETLSEAADPLVTTDNLRLLLRVPAFGQGEFQEAVRLDLQKRLGADGVLGRSVETDIRRLLMTLLSTPPLPPPASVARERFELERSVQAWLLSQHDNAPWLRQQMRRLPDYIVETHPLLNSLITEERNDLWADKTGPVSVPAARNWWIQWQKRWRAFRYRDGLPHRDRLRGLMPHAALVACSAFVFAGLAILPIGPRIPSRFQKLTPDIHSPGRFHFRDASAGTQRIARLTVKNLSSTVLYTLSRVSTTRNKAVPNGQPHSNDAAAGGRAGARPMIDYSPSRLIDRIIQPGKMEDVDILLPTNVISESAESSCAVSIETVSIDGLKRPTSQKIVTTVPVDARPFAERFDKSSLALRADAGKSSPSSEVNLVGKGLPSTQLLANLLRLGQPDQFTFALGGRVTLSTGEEAQAISITYHPAASGTPGATEWTTLSYTDNAGAMASVALSGTVNADTMFTVSPKVVDFGSLSLSGSTPRLTKGFTIRGPAGGTLNGWSIADSAAADVFTPPSQNSGTPLTPDKTGRASSKIMITFAPRVASTYNGTIHLRCVYAGRVSVLTATLKGRALPPKPEKLFAADSVSVHDDRTLEIFLRLTPSGVNNRAALLNGTDYAAEVATTDASASTAIRRLTVEKAEQVYHAGSSIRLTARDPAQRDPYVPGAVFNVRVRFTGLPNVRSIDRNPVILRAVVPKPPPIPVTVEPKALDFGTVNGGANVEKVVAVTGPRDLQIRDVQILDPDKDVPLYVGPQQKPEFYAQSAAGAQAQGPPIPNSVNVRFIAERQPGPRRARLRILFGGAYPPIDVPVSASVKAAVGKD